MVWDREVGWGKVSPNIHIFYPHISIYEVRVSLSKDGCVSCGTVIYIYSCITHTGEAITKSIIHLKIGNALEIHNIKYIIIQGILQDSSPVLDLVAEVGG